ncbi:hypothetical protein PENTCL1PPCAC_26766, partial [Pristionchus entomophagus]
MPIVAKRYHLMGIDSTFTSFAISLGSVPFFIALILFSSENRFQALTSIELGAGISMLGHWSFTEGEVTVCSDSTVYAGVWWWIELVALVITEAFSMAVYIVGSVGRVEVVPTRARTFTVALLFTFSVVCAGITNKMIMKNRLSLSSSSLPLVFSLSLPSLFLSSLSY